MADYTRIIEENDVTNIKSRIILLTQMALNNEEPSGATKNKTTVIPAHYSIDYNVDTIVQSGLFKLSKGFYNYDNTGETSEGKDIEWLYVVKYSDNVIRQFYLSAEDGRTTLTTRIKYKNRWYKWRTPSWLFPKYELIENIKAGRNMHYISFGDYTLTLPSASEFTKGDCVRLDQYEGIGKVTCTTSTCNSCGNIGSKFSTCSKCKSSNITDKTEELTTHSVKNVDRYQSNLDCEGFSKASKFNYTSFYIWTSEDDKYVLTTKFSETDDKFYWCIKENDTILYTSVNDIGTAAHPCDATQWLDTDLKQATIAFTVNDIIDDKGMETCNSYIFEVLNDHYSSGSHGEDWEKKYNYWALTSGSHSRSTRDIINKYIEDGFISLMTNVSTLHIRTTDEVRELNARITEEVRVLNKRIDDEVETLNTRITNEVATLNTRITDEVQTLNDKIDTEVATVNTRITSEVSGIQAKIDEIKDTIKYYLNIDWIAISTNSTTVTETDIYTALENSFKCKYLVSSTSNRIEFPLINISYIEGGTIPEQAAKLNTILDKPIQITLLANSSCTLVNLDATCTVAEKQTATVQLVKYQTKYNSTITNHYEWLFTLQKQL